MRGFLILCCLVGIVFMGLVTFACADPPTNTWTLDPPIELTAGALCTSPAGTFASLATGQPARNVGRVAVAPLRALAAFRPIRRLGAVIAAQPLRRVGRAILNAAPGRRVARLALAPGRWLLRR